MPIALNVQLTLAYFVCAFAAGAGWAVGNWLVHRLLK